jgi:hypothetical protein
MRYRYVLVKNKQNTDTDKQNTDPEPNYSEFWTRSYLTSK